MFFPWMFAFFVLGLIAGGGAAVITAPTIWLVAGLDAPEVMQALTCAVGILDVPQP